MAATASVENVAQSLDSTDTDDVEAGQKRRKRLRKKVTEEDFLRSTKGISSLIGGNGKGLSAFKSQGMGRELADIERLLQHYIDWAHLLNPGEEFAKVLGQIDRLNKSQIQEHLSELREKQYEKIHGKTEQQPMDVQAPEDHDSMNQEPDDPVENQEQTSPKAAPAKPAEELTKSERIRRNREAALKRLEERKKAVANKNAQNNNSKSVLSNPTSSDAPEEDELEDLLRTEQPPQDNLDLPDEDEIDALDDLLGQRNPESQDASSHNGVVRMPSVASEDTMSSLTEAFRIYMPKKAGDEQKSSPKSTATIDKAFNLGLTTAEEQKEPEASSQVGATQIVNPGPSTAENTSALQEEVASQEQETQVVR